MPSVRPPAPSSSPAPTTGGGSNARTAAGATAKPAAGARLVPAAAAAIRAAIRLAGGREVCFVGTVDGADLIQSVRVVSRGDVQSVLALPGFAERGEMLVHNHPSGVLEPSEADLQIAVRMHDSGIGFAIVDNQARSLYVVVEVPCYCEAVPIDPESIAADLGPDGLIAARHRKYEDRPSQREMAATIAKLYNIGGVGLLEAGTGVGKSLGYLVPALRWAAANGERTVISTNTINLQEQLVGSDLPFLAEALRDQKVRFALLKGWRNYLCLLRLEQARAQSPSLLDEGSAAELEALSAWAARTKDGTLADLAAPPKDEVWDEVAAEPDLCLRLSCPHFQRCFLFQARREAAQADVIVVNHHLLLADVAVRRVQQNWDDAAVLPAYRRLVIDEGHHLEDAASAHLGTTVTRRALFRLFNRLERKGGGGGRGLLPALAQALSAKRDLLTAASLDLLREKLAPSVRTARDKSAMVFDLLGMALDTGGDAPLRLTERFDDHPVWRGGLSATLGDLLGELELLGDNLRLIRERHDGETRRDEALLPLFNEVRAVTRRLQTAGDGLRAALQPSPGGPEMVRWMEVRGKERNVAVTAAPLDLAPILREDLFRRVTTAVVTSATLAAEGRFDFLAKRLGLDDPELEPVTQVFPSPFDFPRQALFVVATDTPAPNASPAAHFEAVVRIAIDVAGAADGGMFVLFTSHRDVRQMASEFRARGADRRWPLLVHGEDGRDALLRRFRESERAVLLGTASFWEGVDVPGRALRALVLSKVPFRVPTDPLTQAQCEAIDREGGDSFADYMVPHAALRLKQGFGRLIRSTDDRGVIVLCDSRAATKAYGRALLAGLPPARRIARPWAEAMREVGAWYKT
jgi:ATP-dependent DNA helicase DinG